MKKYIYKKIEKYNIQFIELFKIYLKSNIPYNFSIIIF